MVGNGLDINTAAALVSLSKNDQLVRANQNDNILHKSPSPRVRPIKMQMASVGLTSGGAGNSATLTVGVNHLIPAQGQNSQSRAGTKQIMQTEPRTATLKQKESLQVGH